MILLFNVVLEVLTTEIREGKEVKLSLFAYNMYIYIEDLKDATRKLLELINEFGKVTGYKINTEKSVAFPGYDKQKSATIKKNLLHFNTLTMKDQKEAFKKQFHLPLHQKEYNI